MSGALDPDPDPEPEPEPEPPSPEPLSSPLEPMASGEISIAPYICQRMFGTQPWESIQKMVLHLRAK